MGQNINQTNFDDITTINGADSVLYNQSNVGSNTFLKQQSMGPIQSTVLQAQLQGGVGMFSQTGSRESL